VQGTSCQGVVHERVRGGEPREMRIARLIFKKWLGLRHRGIDLGMPMTDPLPGPFGYWYRVYRRGRIYWHPDPRMNARFGAFSKPATPPPAPDIAPGGTVRREGSTGSAQAGPPGIASHEEG
jgi:hypothetical protein